MAVGGEGRLLPLLLPVVVEVVGRAEGGAKMYAFPAFSSPSPPLASFNNLSTQALYTPGAAAVSGAVSEGVSSRIHRREGGASTGRT